MDSDLEFIEVEIRKRSKPEGDQQPSSQLQSLPRDLVLYILSRLPLSSLVQLRSVCRGWRMLAQDLDLVNMHNTICMDENNPCLIFHSYCSPRDHQLYFVDFPACSHGKEKVKRFQVPFREALPKFDVLGSSNGLLCLSDSLQNVDALYVYNPFIGNYIDLPKSTQYPNQQVAFGFGFHPTTKEYKVIKIVYYRRAVTFYRYPVASAYVRDSEVQIFTLGSSTWRSLGKAGYHYLYRCSSQVLVNGRPHWVTWPLKHHQRMKIVSFDLADEQFREVPSTPLKGTTYQLVVLGGCLSAAVYLNSGTLEIWVMREYDVEESWIKKLNIRAHIPKGLKEDIANQLFKNSNIIRKGRFVRVLCLLKTDEILLEYKSRVLVSYDSKSGEFKELMFQGIPECRYRTVVHAGSLNWID
ncbi:hypothetical protein F2P56_001705 [Juglans regia]|uniref:F-box domain-containing protein n=2 Tax=Juglans regia TaxID=51240 RepID=A0A833YE63_JUGRE|nr:F-box protein At3g07870-like [Juglans regia]KAF5481009.1 hypothetical protein F2P56_001705 [Juglans regia]